MTSDHSQPYISTSIEVELKGKVEDDIFTKDKVYVARSRTQIDSMFYTKYYVKDDNGVDHLVTIEFLLNHFTLVLSERSENGRTN